MMVKQWQYLILQPIFLINLSDDPLHLGHAVIVSFQHLAGGTQNNADILYFVILEDSCHICC